jgi:hypothetical protein
LEYAIRKLQESLVRLKLNGHEFMAYADDGNLVGDNVDTIRKNIKTLIEASREG